MLTVFQSPKDNQSLFGDLSLRLSLWASGFQDTVAPLPGGAVQLLISDAIVPQRRRLRSADLD